MTTTKKAPKRRGISITIDGRTQSAGAWIRERGFNADTFYHRVGRGWDPKRALTEPVRQALSAKERSEQYGKSIAKYQKERSEKLKKIPLAKRKEAWRILGLLRQNPGPGIKCGHTENPDPNCPRCKQRIYRAARRAEGKDLYYSPE